MKIICGGCNRQWTSNSHMIEECFFNQTKEVKKMTENNVPVPTGINETALAALAAQDEKQNEQLQVDAAALTRLVEIIKPSMRLIDKPIERAITWYSDRSGGGSTEREYYPRRGIVLDDDITDVMRGNDTRGSTKGGRLILWRDGTFTKDRVSGDWTRWQGETQGWEVSDTKILTPLEVVGKYEIEDLLAEVNKTIAKASETSEGKLRQLAKRKAICDRILKE